MNISPNPFPPMMSLAVQDYKKVQAEYNKTSDLALKSAYKLILDKKLEELRTTFQTYIASVTTALNALEVS